MNHIRNVHRIHVYGTDIPEPCESFDKLSSDYKLHSRIIQNIQSVGYVTPTPIQIQAIPVMLHVSVRTSHLYLPMHLKREYVLSLC